MVADAVVGRDVGISRSLTPRQLEFGRLFVCEGKTACDAYRLAYSYSGAHADTLSDRLHRRADMQAYLAELRQEAKQSGLLDMADRRRLLAEIVTHKDKPIDPPDWGHRIRAAELDARFTGELRNDLSINGEVSISHVLQSMGEHSLLPAAPADDVIDLPAPGHGDGGEPRTAEAHTVHETPGEPVSGADSVMDSLDGEAWVEEE